MRALLLSSLASAVAGPIARAQCANYEGVSEAFAVNASTSYPVSVWRGIPFAAAPVGPLRWAPPQPFTNCTPSVTVPAIQYGARCIQDEGVGGGGAEDCLFLNVHAPASATPALNLPVLVFFHGGDNTVGSADWYNCTAAIAKFSTGADTGEIIIVTVNYRLNVIGFLTTPDMCNVTNGKGCSNFGLLDQRIALRWVHDNIWVFGGDASRVTISGQSSGGTDVFAHLTSVASRGLFRAGISLSGSPNITMGTLQKYAQDTPFFSQFKCDSGPTPEARVACMRAVNAVLLGNTTPPAWDIPEVFNFPTKVTATGWNAAGIPFFDGDVIQIPLLEALAMSVVDVPLIISSMADEIGIAPGRDVSALSDAQWHDLLLSSFSTSVNPAWEGAGNALYAAYKAQSDVSPQLAFLAIMSDMGVNCASSVLASAGVKRKSPTYIAYNNWTPSHAYYWGSQACPYAVSLRVQKLDAESRVMHITGASHTL